MQKRMVAYEGNSTLINISAYVDNKDPGESKRLLKVEKQGTNDRRDSGDEEESAAVDVMESARSLEKYRKKPEKKDET